MLLSRIGIMRGLVVCGVLMALSNLIFVVQAWVGHDLWMLTLTIAIENVTTGMGTAAFVLPSPPASIPSENSRSRTRTT